MMGRRVRASSMRATTTTKPDEERICFRTTTHRNETLNCHGRWPEARPSPGLALKNNDSLLIHTLQLILLIQYLD